MKYTYSLISLALSGLLFLGATHATSVSLPSNVNFPKVQSAWLDRQNQERTKLGLSGYTGNELLQSAAQQRAESLKNMGGVTHQRLTTDGYYNYRSIKNWFADHGVAFRDESGTMFSESLGRGYYSCKRNDCTDTLIKAIKSTFVFFMNEKNKKYQPHYKAIINKDFTSVGLGIATVGKQYYLVSHYGKNVVASSGTKVELVKK